MVGVGGRLVKRERERERDGGRDWDALGYMWYMYYMYQGYRRLRGLVGWNNIYRSTS